MGRPAAQYADAIAPYVLRQGTVSSRTGGHTGRPIATSAATFTIYVLVTLGAILRLAAPFAGDLYLATLFAGGVLWSGAFGLFVLAYAPVLLRPGLGRT